ncbi:MAG: hypothetical protein ACFFG0_18950 [Candidatus Thorarchaeota archaeon]
MDFEEFDKHKFSKLLTDLNRDIEEDRKLALENYKTIRKLIEKLSGDGLGDVIAIQELSEALERFLKTSAKASENRLRLAKIVSDQLLKDRDTGSLYDDLLGLQMGDDTGHPKDPFERKEDEVENAFES